MNTEENTVAMSNVDGEESPSSSMGPPASRMVAPLASKQTKRKRMTLSERTQLVEAAERSQASSSQADTSNSTIIGNGSNSVKGIKKSRKQAVKYYNGVMAFDFYDKLSIYGQHMYILSELERESNFLKDVHKRMSEQIHKLQIEESIMQKQFQLILQNQQEREESEAPTQPQYLSHYIEHTMNNDIFENPTFGLPAHEMSTDTIKYAPVPDEETRNKMKIHADHNWMNQAGSSSNNNASEDLPKFTVTSDSFKTLQSIVEQDNHMW